MIYLKNTNEIQEVHIAKNGNYVGKKTYKEGYTDGIEAQKGLIEPVTITENGVYENPNGFNPVSVNVPPPNVYTRQKTFIPTSEELFGNDKNFFINALDEGYDGYQYIVVKTKDILDEEYNKGYSDGSNGVMPECPEPLLYTLNKNLSGGEYESRITLEDLPQSSYVEYDGFKGVNINAYPLSKTTYTIATEMAKKDIEDTEVGFFQNGYFYLSSEEFPYVWFMSKTVTLGWKLDTIKTHYIKVKFRFTKEMLNGKNGWIFGKTDETNYDDSNRFGIEVGGNENNGWINYWQNGLKQQIEVEYGKWITFTSYPNPDNSDIRIIECANQYFEVSNDEMLIDEYRVNTVIVGGLGYDATKNIIDGTEYTGQIAEIIINGDNLEITSKLSGNAYTGNGSFILNGIDQNSSVTGVTGKQILYDTAIVREYPSSIYIDVPSGGGGDCPELEEIIITENGLYEGAYDKVYVKVYSDSITLTDYSFLTIKAKVTNAGYVDDYFNTDSILMLGNKISRIPSICLQNNGNDKYFYVFSNLEEQYKINQPFPRKEEVLELELNNVYNVNTEGLKSYSNLKSVTFNLDFPNSELLLGYRSFQDCTSLESITFNIPDSCSVAYDETFVNCPSTGTLRVKEGFDTSNLPSPINNWTIEIISE